MKTTIKNIETAKAAIFTNALTESGFTFKTRDILGKMTAVEIEYNPHHGEQAIIEYLLTCARA